MRVLSIRQPWVELILQGKKTIELRTWNTKFRGEFLLHASKRVDDAGRAVAKKFGIELQSLEKGSIVGRAELVDVIVYNSREELLKDRHRHFASDARKYPVYGFVLKGVERLKPKKCKGRLGFFEV